MAEYRALAQNTYKFINETTISTESTDLFSPYGTKLGCVPIKKILGSTSTPLEPIIYMQLSPTYCDISPKLSASNAELKKYSGTSTPSYNQTPTPSSVIVDGTTYYGFKNASYDFYWGSGYSSSGATSSTYYGCQSQPMKINVIKYVNSSQTIVNETYNLETNNLNSSIKGTSTQSATGYILCYLTVPKATNDIILSITVEPIA